MKSKLYFFHIHKVGGNSLVKVLRKGYSENEILPVGLWREIIALPREEIMRYRFFSGHFGTGLYSLLKEEPPTVTLLRDPFERAVSQILYWQRITAKNVQKRVWNQGVLSLKKLAPAILTGSDLEEALSSPLVRAYLQDYQARSLGIPLNLEPWLGKDPQGVNFHELLSDQEKGQDLSRVRVVALAKERIDKCLAVGLTERMGDSIRLFCKRVGTHPPFLTPMENSHPLRAKRPFLSYREGKNLSQESIKTLDELVAGDLEVYQYARQKFEKEMVSLGRTFSSFPLEPREAPRPVVVSLYAATRLQEKYEGLLYRVGHRGWKETAEEVSSRWNKWFWIKRETLLTEFHAPRIPLYFFHIHKTGGMSLSKILKALYRKEDRIGFRDWQQLLKIPQEQLEKCLCFDGHFATGLYSLRDERDLRSVTFLRDPFERTVSNLRFWQYTIPEGVQKGIRPAGMLKDLSALLTAGLSLREALEDPFIVDLFRNYQTRMLGTPIDFKQIQEKEKVKYPFPFLLLEQSRGISEEELFERAKERLRKMAVIGFTEEMGEGVAQVCRLLGVAPPEVLPEENTNTARKSVRERYRGREEFSGEVEEIIDNITVYDRRLYQYAKALGKH